MFQSSSSLYKVKKKKDKTKNKTKKNKKRSKAKHLQQSNSKNKLCLHPDRNCFAGKSVQLKQKGNLIMIKYNNYTIWSTRKIQQLYNIEKNTTWPSTKVVITASPFHILKNWRWFLRRRRSVLSERITILLSYKYNISIMLKYAQTLVAVKV